MTFKFRYTDLSKDSGKPWLVAHILGSQPLPNGNEQRWTGYGETLMEAVCNGLKAQDEELGMVIPQTQERFTGGVNASN